MIDPVVRPAERRDVPELIDLEASARDALVEARGGARWLDEHPSIDGGWPQLLADATRQVFVAELDSIVTGFLVLVLEPDSTARIDQVYVMPEARHVGFGDALIEAAVDAATARGCVRIEGQALPGDRETKNLYERAGITARLIVVSAPLGARPLSGPSTAGGASR